MNKKSYYYKSVFPEIATRRRCEWAGLSFDDFAHVTHAENSNYCKPILIILLKCELDKCKLQKEY